MKYTFLNLYILFVYAIMKQQHFKIGLHSSELTFTRILEGSLFHNIAAAAI